MKASSRMRTWVAQNPKQVAKVGADKARWYVHWRDPSQKQRCKSCGPGTQGRRLAKNEAQRIHAELITETYDAKQKEPWSAFRDEFDRLVLGANGKATTETEIRNALKHFERIIEPGRTADITTKTIEEYKLKRSCEGGKKEGDTISPATVNKELRIIKAVLRRAAEWEYLKVPPKVTFIREPKRLATFVTPAEFAAIYEKCDGARLPANATHETAAWWRALITMAYMTGWRIIELLAVQRADVDLAAGTAITRAEDNKGGRDEVTPLHPLVVEHLRGIPSFDQFLFPMSCNLRTLYNQFADLQEAADIHLACRGHHEHTRFCHVYGFHDFRRAFATNNAGQLSAVQLQTLMRHKSFQTTTKYINMASQLGGVTDRYFVPAVGKAASASV